MHMVIYTVAVAAKNPPPPKQKQKHANKYTEKIHDVQIHIVQQRISKTKNYGGKGGGGEKKERKKKSKCFPGEIAGLAAQILISNITFGFTVIFTIIYSKCSMQASNSSLLVNATKQRVVMSANIDCCCFADSIHCQIYITGRCPQKASCDLASR